VEERLGFFDDLFFNFFDFLVTFMIFFGNTNHFWKDSNPPKVLHLFIEIYGTKCFG
jgi:hypothetical protein